MPKYFCDYCDTYLTHDSPSVRKTHCGGRKHKENVRLYYQKWLEDQVQKLVDDTTAAYKQGKIASNPFQGVAPGGAMIPPPANIAANPAMKPPLAPGAVPIARPGIPPVGMRMMGPAGPMPAMMPGMRGPMGAPVARPMAPMMMAARPPIQMAAMRPPILTAPTPTAPPPAAPAATSAPVTNT